MLSRAASHDVQHVAGLPPQGSQKRGRESFLGGIYIALLSAFVLEGGLDGHPLRVSTDGDARRAILAGRARSRDGLSRLSGLFG